MYYLNWNILQLSSVFLPVNSNQDALIWDQSRLWEIWCRMCLPAIQNSEIILENSSSSEETPNSAHLQDEKLVTVGEIRVKCIISTLCIKLYQLGDLEKARAPASWEVKSRFYRHLGAWWAEFHGYWVTLLIEGPSSSAEREHRGPTWLWYCLSHQA